MVTLQQSNLTNTILSMWWRWTAVVIRYYHLVWYTKRGTSPLWYFFQKNSTVSIKPWKASDKLKQRNVSQNIWPLMGKTIKVMRFKENWETVEIRKDRGNLTAECCVLSWTVSRNGWRASWKIQWNLNKTYGLVHSIVLVLISWFW